MTNTRNEEFYILPIDKNNTAVIYKSKHISDIAYTYEGPIKEVIHNDPATIVYWLDGTRTVVKCGEDDVYDPEKGLAMAIAKKFLGNKGNYYDTFKKWLPEEEDHDLGEYSFASESLGKIVEEWNEAARKALMKLLLDGIRD